MVAWGQRHTARWERKVPNHLLIRTLEKNRAIKHYTGIFSLFFVTPKHPPLTAFDVGPP